MFRVRLIAAAAVIALGPALAGCSGGSLALPDWMTFKPPPPPMVALQFESEPPGADVHTEQSQTCRTPCSLAVPVTNQSVTFTMVGFQPQTIPVEVTETTQLTPNPVQASLVPSTPPPPKRPAKPRKRPTPKPAKTTTAPPPSPPPQPASAAPPPPAAAPDTLGNRFSPPPSNSPFPPPPSSSPFPPPPPAQR